MKCEICEKEYKILGSHVQTHNISIKDYYDTYIKQPGEGICPVCGKETKFFSLNKGYQRHCNNICAQKDPATRQKFHETNLKRFGVINFFQLKNIQSKAEKNAHSEQAEQKRIQTVQLHFGVDNPAQSTEIQSKIQQTNLDRYGSRAYNHEKGKQTMLNQYGHEYALRVPEFKNKQEITEKLKWETLAKENDWILVQDLLKQYGHGWYQSEIGKSIVFTIGQQAFIKHEDLDKIQQYISNINTSSSKKEQELKDFIRTFHDNLIENSRRTIGRSELDIYLPDLKLAVEYNGIWYHCIENGTAINYHLRKSILCRKKEIRLIHIYEFEDFEEQKQLLKDLILGQDNYPKNDFNKNNLLEHIPDPEIIYQNNGCTIYGAGKLY